MTACRRFLYILAALILLTGIAPGANAANPSAAEKGALALVKDINTANEPSEPYQFFSLGDRFLFVADDGGLDWEPFVSDGTSTGTHKLKELYVGSAFYGYNDRAFFSACQLGSGMCSANLWATDGTPDGTYMVYDFPEDFFRLRQAVVFDGWLYFIASFQGQDNRVWSELWRTDGIQGHTTRVTDLDLTNADDYDTRNLAVMDGDNGGLFFRAGDDQNGFELWRMANAGGQPERVKDICPESCGGMLPGSNPRWITPVPTAAGNLLFFVADDAAHGAELWVSDGTEGGTRIVRDIRDGSEGSSPAGLTPVGGWLYFTADGGTNGVAVWRSDGSQGGTTPVINLASGMGYTNPLELTAMGGMLFFTADSGTYGSELWKVAGPQAAPEVIDIAAGPTGSFPNWLTVVGQGAGAALYFSAQKAPGNSELWRSGGSAETTRLVKVIAPGSPAGLRELHAWNNHLVFAGTDADHAREPWISDGTDAGTHLITDVNTVNNSYGSMPGDFHAFNGVTYFTAVDYMHGWMVWRTNGTPEGTQPLAGFPSGEMLNTLQDNLAELNGFVYLAMPDPTLNWDAETHAANDPYGSELWRTDGTPAGTSRFMDIRPGPLSSFPYKFTRVGDKIFFFANDGEHGKGLWLTDGTKSGTRYVTNAVPFMDDYGGMYPYFYTGPTGAAGDWFVFITAEPDATLGTRSTLWRSDGTPEGTQAFYKIETRQDDPINMQSFAANLYFSLETPEGGKRLFVTDGTAPGTQELQTPGNDGLEFSQMAVSQGSLYFTMVTPPPLDPPGDPTTVLWKLAPGSITAQKVLDFPQQSIDPMTGSAGSGLAMRVKSAGGSRWWVLNGAMQPPTEVCPKCSYTTAGQGHAFYQGRFFFTAAENGGAEGSGMKLWVSGEDGSAYPLNSSLALEDASPLFASPTGLLFPADDGIHGQELWSYRVEYTYLPAIRR